MQQPNDGEPMNKNPIHWSFITLNIIIGIGLAVLIFLNPTL